MALRHHQMLLGLLGLLATFTVACSEPEPTLPPTTAPEGASPSERTAASTRSSPTQVIQTPIPASDQPAPSASFSVDVESGNAPLVVKFNNTSQGPITSTKWDFGDGTTGSDQTATHRYTIAGLYTVKLTVSGPGGSDSRVITDLITVEPGTPTTAEVTPTKMTLAVQEGTRFAAIARDEFGNAVASIATWSVASEGGSIDKDGLFTASTVAGTFNDMIQAYVQTDASSFTATSTVIVEPGVISRIVVEPAEATLDIGGPQTFTFAAFDTFNNEVDDAIAAWTISPDLGEIDAKGVLITGTRAGIYPNAVRVEGVKDSKRVSATADITIRPNPIDSIELKPSFVVVERGATQKFEATAFDEFSNEISELNFGWETTGGEISKEGIFTAGQNPGSYEVNVAATFKDSTFEVAASVPVPPVWIPSGDMVQAHAFHAAARLPDGKVLIAGGGTAEIYDPSTGIFRSLGITPCFHQSLNTMTPLLDGKVLVAGAQFDQRCADVFDPKTETFSKVGDMNEDHFYHSATLLPDGKVLIAGGQRYLDDGRVESHSAAEIYDPDTQTFSSIEDLNFERSGHTATLLPSGKVLIATGANEKRLNDERVSIDCLDSAEIYDPATSAFTLVQGKLRSRPCGAFASLLDDGNVLITRSRQPDLFDSETGTFSFTGATAVDHSWHHTSTLLHDGQVLIVGGPEQGGGALHAVEIYDPESRTFSTADSLKEPRKGHTATLLSNGWVLVAGGNNGESILRSTELFIPSSLP